MPFLPARSHAADPFNRIPCQAAAAVISIETDAVPGQFLYQRLKCFRRSVGSDSVIGEIIVVGRLIVIEIAGPV